MKKSRIILLAGLGVVIIAIAIGLSMYYKPHKTFAGAEPDFRLTVPQLIAAFTSDEAAATAKYVAEDKVILVSGTVLDVITEDSGTVVIVLGEEGVEGTVSCTLTAEESAHAERIKEGGSAQITGQCTGMQGLIEPEVILIRCGLVSD